MVSLTVEFLAFDVTVMDFAMVPTLFVSYLTFIELDFPGRMGSLGHSATVHPHDERTLLRTNGFVPVLVKVNSH